MVHFLLLLNRLLARQGVRTLVVRQFKRHFLGLSVRFFFTGGTEVFFDLNFNVDSLHVVQVVVHVSAIVLAEQPVLVSDLNPREFNPGLERNLEVHDGQERIDFVLFLDQVSQYLIAVWSSFQLPSLQGQVVNLELSLELKDLHFLAQLHGSILALHAAVKQLVEVDVAFFALDAHLEQLLLQVSVVVELFVEAQAVVTFTIFAQLPEELGQLVFFDLPALVAFHGEFLPHLHKALQVIFEEGDHAFALQVVLFELLDDNQDEQVEHDVRAGQHHDIEVPVREGGSTAVFAFDASVFSCA